MSKSTKHQTSVRLCELEAMRPFMSEDESRYVLCGMRVEIHDGKTLLIATDGRRLAVLQSQCKFALPPQASSVGFIIPSQLFDRMQWKTEHWVGDGYGGMEKGAYGRNDPYNFVLIEFDSETNRVRLTHQGPKYTVEADVIDGGYPNWRKVIPGDRPEQPTVVFRSINTEYLAAFGKAARSLEGGFETVTVWFHGGNDSVPGPVEVQSISVPYFYGVLMCCKTDVAPPMPPDWLKLPPIQAPTNPPTP